MDLGVDIDHVLATICIVGGLIAGAILYLQERNKKWKY